MITVDETVKTTLAPTEAFDYLKNFEHTSEWDPGTPVVEKTSTGPVAVGSTFHAEAEFKGKRQPLEYEVTALTANSITLRGENKTVISVDTITVTPSGPGSAVNYKAQFSLKSWKKIAEPFVRDTFQGLAEPAVDGMKRKLDSLAR